MKLTHQPRYAVLADASGIAQTHVDTWRVAYKGLLSETYLAELNVEDRMMAWQKKLTPPIQSTILVVENNDHCSPIKILGFAVGGQIRDENGDLSSDAHDGEIFAIYVHPNYFGQKIGAALMVKMETILAQQRHQKICIWYMKGNAQAEKFYYNFGYRFDGVTSTKLFTSSAGSEEKILIRVAKSIETLP